MGNPETTPAEMARAISAEKNDGDPTHWYNKIDKAIRDGKMAVLWKTTTNQRIVLVETGRKFFEGDPVAELAVKRLGGTDGDTTILGRG